MRSLRFGLVGSLVVCCIATVSARPYDAAHEFEGHRFTLKVPEDYRLEGEVSPMPGVKNFAFATAPRTDGTRGVIQITILDLKKSGAPAGLTLDKFADQMIESIRTRRMQWMAKEAPQRIAGVAGRRIDWSGVADLGRGRGALMLRGVMIVGIKGNVGFALTTQDLTTDAVRACAKALMSFDLTVRK